jgi:hypothetical protein
MITRRNLWVLILILQPVLAFCQADSTLKKRVDSLLLVVIRHGGYRKKQVLLPNELSKTSMTPTAWSGKSLYIYAGFGGDWPAPYYTKMKLTKANWWGIDLTSCYGLGFGDPRKTCSLTAMVNVTDISGFTNLSYNFILSRWIGEAGSLSIGGLNLFGHNDATASYYIAYSRAVQKYPSKIHGRTRLCYTVGFGSGRFLNKSPLDIQYGKGKYGTGLFGNISYELNPKVNVGMEWSGLNLGVLIGYKPFRNLPCISIGILDLTPNAGTIRMAMSVGYSKNIITKKAANK